MTRNVWPQELRYNTGSAIRPKKGCQSCILQFLMKPVVSHKIASSNFFGWNQWFHTILPPPIFRWNQWFHRGKWRLQFHSLETTGFIEEIRECNSWHRFLCHSTGPPNRSRQPFFWLMVPPWAGPTVFNSGDWSNLFSVRVIDFHYSVSRIAYRVFLFPMWTPLGPWRVYRV